MKTVIYHEMEYQELDELVKKYFPMADFEFVADMEMGNDSEKSFGTITKTDINNWGEYIKTRFNNAILGKPGPYIANLFLQYFVANDILPEGNYLIKVSW